MLLLNILFLVRMHCTSQFRRIQSFQKVKIRCKICNTSFEEALFQRNQFSYTKVTPKQEWPSYQGWKLKGNDPCWRTRASGYTSRALAAGQKLWVFSPTISTTDVIKISVTGRKTFACYPVVGREWEIILDIPSRLLVFWLSQQGCVRPVPTAVLLLRQCQSWPGMARFLEHSIFFFRMKEERK